MQIFAEHEFLQKENTLLKEQTKLLQQSLTESERMIADYRTAILNLETNHIQTDKLRQATIDAYREQLEQQKKIYRRRTIFCTAGGVAAGMIIGIAVK